MLRPAKVAGDFCARYAGELRLPSHKPWTNKNFRTRADEALEDLTGGSRPRERRHDFEADFNAGALAIEFEEPPAKFVVSPNAPVSQIWVSAHMKSFKLDWDPARARSCCPTRARRWWSWSPTRSGSNWGRSELSF